MRNDFNFTKVIPVETGKEYIGVHIGKTFKLGFSKGLQNKYNIESGKNFDLGVSVENNALRVYFNDSGDFVTKKTVQGALYNSATSGLKHTGVPVGRYMLIEEEGGEFVFVNKKGL